MATDAPIGELVLFEDFLRDNVTGLVETVASGATQDVISRHGGWWRQVMAGDDDDAACLAAELAWEVDESDPLIFEVRLRNSVVASASIFVGMSDSNADSVVIEDEDGTLNTVATDAVGFLLEGQQDVTWQAVGVQNNVDNTQLAFTSGDDAANDIVQTLRMELWARNSGLARFFLDGAQAVADRTSYFRSGIVMTPVLSCDDRATAYNAEYDYVYVSAGRS